VRGNGQGLSRPGPGNTRINSPPAENDAGREVFPAYQKARPSRFFTFVTCHCPPLVVRTPLAFRAAAMPRRSVMPVSRTAWMIGRVLAANSFAFSASTFRPSAAASGALRWSPAELLQPSSPRSRAGPLRNQPAFLLREYSVQVHHQKRSASDAQLRHDERHTLDHQRGHKCHGAGKSIELGRDHRTAL
jgi:hypothetical protein